MRSESIEYRVTWFGARLALAVIAALLIAGCATPVGVSRVKESDVYRQIDASALTTKTFSDHTAIVLHRHGIKGNEFFDHPAAVIRKLHEIACNDDRRDLLLTLSELCYLAAPRAKVEKKIPPGPDSPQKKRPVYSSDYYLGASVYAYLYLMGEGSEPPPGPFDRRFRLACDLYNRSLANQLNFISERIELSDKIMAMPVGQIHVTFKTVEVPWNTEELATILPADTFEVHGLSIRNRVSGLGAPILAVRKRQPGKPVTSAVAATLFAEIKGSIRDIDNGTCQAEVSLYSPEAMGENEITLDGKKIPLEIDMTAPIAYALNDPIVWKMGRNLFRLGRSPFKPGLYASHPYAPGRIPIVFVHGTMSSPVWWAEMFNTLSSDPRIRQRFQIWMYLYDSGKPVVFSAAHLRESIAKKIREYDPEGRDPALNDIVVVGHSQGGLLTRWTVTESGDTLIRAATGKSLDELDLSPEQMETVTRYAVIHPMPEVSRVIFISTPHRGSILAGNIVRRIAAKFISLPREVIQTGADLFNFYERFSLAGKLKWSIPRTSIDSMSPENPALLAMAELPFPPEVKAHSIIAVKGKEKPPEGDDGVVAYKSAHLEGVASELVVPYGHSCQDKPEVIEEVRRILIEHLEDLEHKKTENPVH
ncbi:MAG: hypothetical protein AB1724_08830 [Thermodesulfobacteriota bacterium]